MKPRLLHLFNPTCEMEVANAKASYMPPAHLLKFAQDLDTLPLTYAAPQDGVLVHHLPPVAFIDRLESAGFHLPEFFLSHEIEGLKNTFVPTPWGRSPAAAHKLKTLRASWDEHLRSFFSRQFAQNIVHQLLEKNLPHCMDAGDAAQHVESPEEVEKWQLAWGKVVIKAPYSSSGRGIQMLRFRHLDHNTIHKIRSIIRQQGGVMVEPLLEKICDFAYEFQIKKGQIHFVGYSHFITNEKGQYSGHLIPFTPQKLHQEAQNLWNIGVINAAREELHSVLEKSGLCKLYEGYLGVDAFVFHNQKGEPLLHPCVEINLRNNMGIVALHIEKRIAPDSSGEFNIISNPPVSLKIFDMDLRNKHPLKMDKQKIAAGYLPLTPPDESALSMAYLLVRG